MPEPSPAKPSASARLARELKNYALISAYLYVCFSVILLYEAALLPGGQAGLLDHGAALVKALVVGKFVLIGDAMDAGARISASSMWQRIAYRCAGMLVVLAVLKLIEEWIVGMVHDKSFATVLGEMTAEPWIQLLAPVLLMLLILIPLITATEIDRALGRGRLKAMLLGKAGERD